jgi:DNA-binding transcriptional LysR family regulator
LSVSSNWRKLGSATKGIFFTSDEHNSSIVGLRRVAARAIPPLPALLAFERAAWQLSFRRAARDLSLSPSANSHQIRGLEEQFRTKLFVRGARSVRLTADGERYFAKVSAALAALQDASRDMLRHRRDAHAELWISSLPFFTSAVLIPALPEFKRRNPALLWLDSVPAMLEAAEQGLGVTLGMSPLIMARPGFGKKLVTPFAFEAAHSETIYLVSRTEQARDRRIAAVRRWIVEAVGRVK